MHIDLPPGWAPIEIPENLSSAAYIAVGPRGSRDYVPSIVVTHVEHVETNLEDWAQSTSATSLEEISGLIILDAGLTEIGGIPAVSTLQVLTVDDVNVTQLQLLFILEAGGSRPGYVVTATCASADYLELADTLAQMTLSFRPKGTVR